MTFVKYIEKATRLKELRVELHRLIEPEYIDMVATGSFIITDRSNVKAVFEGNSGKDIVIHKKVINLLNATEKTALLNIMEKLALLANDAIDN